MVEEEKTRGVSWQDYRDLVEETVLMLGELNSLKLMVLRSPRVLIRAMLIGSVST